MLQNEVILIFEKLIGSTFHLALMVHLKDKLDASFNNQVEIVRGGSVFLWRKYFLTSVVKCWLIKQCAEIFDQLNRL